MPDLQPRCASQPLCFHEAQDADYAFVKDGLADLGHQWWFSADLAAEDARVMLGHITPRERRDTAE